MTLFDFVRRVERSGADLSLISVVFEGNIFKLGPVVAYHHFQIKGNRTDKFVNIYSDSGNGTREVSKISLGILGGIKVASRLTPDPLDDNLF